MHRLPSSTDTDSYCDTVSDAYCHPHGKPLYRLGLLNPHPYRTFTEPAQLPVPLAALEVGKSYLNAQQDTALPHSLPWHPRLSERLGLFRLVECPGSHELCFSDPASAALHIERAGRD